ncbi:HemY protein [Hoeflea marina]|uniref:HemY protein n=1 Tax=Hoeflea marina TaxID=274592 RepID=A0A317PH93_9HYPH|nr:heme biosynthesis protein HemY [Hoeflea marina]PWV98261.1 HemY protein [Hoeflea marina]
MIRLLFFVALILAMGFGFAWLADRPGDLTIAWQGQRIEMSLMVAVTAVVSLIVVIMVGWWLIRAIIVSPRTVSRYFRASKRDRGYQALSTGLIAAGAGDAALARKMNKRTKSLLSADQEPLIHLLDVQAALIEGRHEEARALFEAMAEDPETRELGLRGLYLEARRLGAEEAANHYAETAAEKAPHLPWAGQATLANRTRERKWDEALSLLDRQKQAGMLNRAETDRKRAVLLTARAMDHLDADPAGARDDGLAAVRLAPGLVPAAMIAARALFREDNLRKGSKILETLWKTTPHPDVAELYVRARLGDSVSDRLKRAQRLESLRPHNPESLFAVARAALDAKRYDLARAKAEAAARLQPREGVFLLLADIEEAETGDQGRIRHWLSQALRAPRDPAWTADGYVSDTWEPVSPVSGTLDAFEWKVPLEQLSGPLLDHETATASVDRAISTLPPLLARATEAEADGVRAPRPAAVSAAVAQADTAAATNESPAGAVIEVAATPIEHADDADATSRQAEPQPAATAPAEAGGSPGPEAPQTAPSSSTARPVPADMPAEESEIAAREAAFLNHRPDDPGVDEETTAETKQRFRLF